MFRRAVTAFILLIAVFSSIFAISVHSVKAQELTPEERASLQKQYDELQREIAIQQQIIKAAQAQINAKNITIKQLAAQIMKKNVVISELENRIDRGKEALASILRQTQMLDDYSVVSVALSAQSVSGFFGDLDAFTSIKTDLQSLFANIRAAKAQTENEKADLTVKQNQTADAKYEVEIKQKQIASDKTEKQQLLTITKNQEVEYKKVLAERQAKSAAIRAALFPLRDASAITFESALAYAKEAHTNTGVRPALILAVLTQESNLGKNVGQCYLTNNSTGAGVGKNTGTAFSKVMNPTRDVPPFIELGLQLGFDPHRQVVSCPIASAGGWGGAMGPAQFIPSTWALYATRVASAGGVSIANPWDPRDAIMAMSIYLGGLGAGAGGYSAESTAAAKYYAGGAWATAGRTYARNVMALAESIQGNIDFLSDN
jgi:peptidoglycan hydrolase CwlO-like protein